MNGSALIARYRNAAAVTARLNPLLAVVFVGSIAVSAGADVVETRIEQATPERIVIHYELGAFTRTPVLIQGDEYAKIALGKESLMKQVVGAPELPNVCRSIIIPDDARMEARVLESESYELKDIAVAPSKGFILRTVNPEQVPYTFGDAYGRDAYYPGELVSLRDPYILRDYRGVVVELYPFQYNPVTRTLRVYTSMTVEVLRTGPGQINVLERRQRSLSRTFHQVYRHHFLNYDRALKYDPLDEEGDMLIICHDAWLDNVQPLVDHKNNMGISTTAVGVSTIGNNAVSIQAYIQNEYDTGDLAFVLLVGDHLEVAPPYAHGGPADPTYALVDGNDDYPDIFVGRFSAETAAHVDTQVERTISYESVPAPVQDWWSKGTGVASNQGPGDDGEFDNEHMDNIRDDLLAYGHNPVDQIYDPNGTAAQVTAALNEGRGIINYCGHGSPTSWASTGFSNAHVDALTNENMLPFNFSVACVCGKFDFAASPCFGETWLRATNGTEPTGAIAVYMSSINQSWSPPMCAQDESVDLLVAEEYMSFGALAFAGSCQMIDEYGAGGSEMFDTWIVFGDPSVRVWVRDCNKNGVDDAEDITSGTSEDVNGNGIPDECDTRHVVILLDRTGSMRAKRENGNMRCADALETAKQDVADHFDNYPLGSAAVWTFAGSSPTDLTGGFVNEADATAALNGLTADGCWGVTPLAESMCDAIDELTDTFTAEFAGQLILAVSSDGGENNSDGECDGFHDSGGPPYSAGSWQRKVLDKLEIAEVVAQSRYWGSVSKSESGIDPETGEAVDRSSEGDAEFFEYLAASSGGTYAYMDDYNVGACCSVLHLCDDPVSASDCLDQDGTYQGDGTTCAGDADGDGFSDLCDTCTDTDDDGYGNPGYPANQCPHDNCPDIFNPTQSDLDTDWFGFECDNCPSTYNPDQDDSDGDGIGDVCDLSIGACCDAETGACWHESPWVCTAGGDFFQGEDTLCGICEDGITPCEQFPSDPACTVECFPLGTCGSGACCEVATGDCQELGEPALCPVPLYEWQGFGTDCEPNCCEQPVSTYTGGDDCASAIVHFISVPPLGEWPVRITITGDNSSATFNDYPDVCGHEIFNPDGSTQDPGWWEAFEIDDCAEVRVELCCTDVDGQPWEPAWGSLWAQCDPCRGTVAPTGVDSPVGKGVGTTGFDRGGPFCDDDNLWLTFGPLPSGTYYYPLYSAPDGTGASPPGAQYQLSIVVGACPIATCCVEDQCFIVNELACEELGGYWIYANVDCGFDVTCALPPGETDNPCCTGSCCTGPGECEDETPSGQPMTKDDCLTFLGGDYVGGPLCDDDPRPCPICDMEGDTNCQLPRLDAPDLVMMSDPSMPPNGVVVADDFIPTFPEVSAVCVWGAYLDPAVPGFDCNAAVTDNFRITIYQDDNGKPDDSSPVGTAAGHAIAKGPVDSGWQDQLFPNAQMYAYQLEVDPPIAGMNVGEVYWIEVANYTSPVPPDGETCYWHWAQTSHEANDFHYVGTDRDYKDPAYMYGMGRSGAAGDMAFCLDMDMITPPAVVGACCDCDTEVCTVATLTDCKGDGQWDQTGDCLSPCQIPPPGDDCVVDAIATSGDFTYPFDSSCATTDGPTLELSEMGLISFGRDIWVHYTVPCDGRLHVSMCGTGNADNAYDSALAVYVDADNRTHCACPGDPGFTRIGLAQDESCNGIDDGGAGYLWPTPLMTAGECITVRAGGHNADGGPGTVKIDCEPKCTPSTEPLPDFCPVPPDIGFGTKNRYMTFRGGDPGLVQAVRVTFASLPPPFDYAEGRKMWVQEPFLVGEPSGSPEPADANFWGARLGCTPFCTDWTQYDRVDVFGGEIVPSAVYDVQFIECNCSFWDESAYSAPLSVRLSRAGDVAGDCGLPPCASPKGGQDCCSAPQGVVDFVDISAAVEKFKNVPCIVRKARADVINSTITLPEPDRKVDFVDISCIVEAFRGSPCPLPGPPVVDPCD